MEGAQPLAVALPSGMASGPRLWKLVTSTRSGGTPNWSETPPQVTIVLWFNQN